MKFCGLKLAVLAVSCSAGLCLAAESEGAVSAGMGELCFVNYFQAQF